MQKNGTQDGTANVTADGTIIKTYKSITYNKEKLFLLDKLQDILRTDSGWLGNVRNI